MANPLLIDEMAQPSSFQQMQRPNFFQRLGQEFAMGTTPERRRFNLRRQELGLEETKLNEMMRHNQAQEGLFGARTGAIEGRTGAMATESARKAEEDKWQKIGKAFQSANDILKYTDDVDAANSVLQSFFKDDPSPPIKGVQFSKKNKVMQWNLDDGDFIINQADFQKMIDAVQAGGDIRQGLKDAEGKGIGVWIKKGAKAKTEHEKVVEEQGKEKIEIERQKLGVQREKVKAQKEKGAARKFKEEKIREMWDSLSEDEKKKFVGAGIDPHELTEKNILDVYGNIMTDPGVKKALQPIAEKIMQKATEKGQGEPKELDEATAKKILLEAKGDKVKARKIAKERGFKF